MSIRLSILISFASVLLLSCKFGEKKEITKPLVVREDTTFTNLFLPTNEGFSGGDGTYSVVLPDGNTLWIFGDSFLGHVTDDFKRIKTDPPYIRNCFVEFKQGVKYTYHQGSPEEYKSMMIPIEVSKLGSSFTEKDLWYWPGEGIISDQKLLVFGSLFSQKDFNDMWGFRYEGLDLLEFSLENLDVQNVYHLQDLDSIHFGHAVYQDESTTYIYGLKEGAIYVAKAKEIRDRNSWLFFDGMDWTTSIENSKPMLVFNGSEQFSVFKYNEDYVLIDQGGDLDRSIFSFTSKSPYGPWVNKKTIYETPMIENCESCWTYNALAHPQFNQDGELLISYNTNSMKMSDHYDNALIYRPRFIRVPLEFIVKPEE